MHILTAIPNCYYQSLEKPNTQPRETFAKGDSYGVSSVKQYSWKDLFEKMEQRSNPWGLAPSERVKWSTLLGDRSFKPGEMSTSFLSAVPAPLTAATST